MMKNKSIKIEKQKIFFWKIKTRLIENKSTTTTTTTQLNKISLFCLEYFR